MLRRFCLPAKENVSTIIIHYLDSQNTLKGKSRAIEEKWAALAYDHHLATHMMFADSQGLHILVEDFSDALEIEDAWQQTLLAYGLREVQSEPHPAPRHRKSVLVEGV